MKNLQRIKALNNFLLSENKKEIIIFERLNVKRSETEDSRSFLGSLGIDQLKYLVVLGVGGFVFMNKMGVGFGSNGTRRGNGRAGLRRGANSSHYISPRVKQMFKNDPKIASRR